MIAESHNLTIGYRQRPVVRSLDFEIREGQVVLLLGHNGAGKSTLLKTLFGMLAPIAGVCKVAGHDPQSTPASKMIRSGIRYLGQGIRTFDNLTVRQSRRVLADLYGMSVLGSEFLEISRNAEDSIVGELSVGQRRLEAMILLSAGEPRLFLLDEPMAGLDQIARQNVSEFVARLARDFGASFLIAEHEYRELLHTARAEKVLFVKEGRMSYFGETAAVFAMEREIMNLYF